MSRIVLTTSSSGLDNIPIQTNIRLIRMRIFVNNVEFIDGQNINLKTLANMMTKRTQSPVYTKPAPASDIVDMFNKLESEGYKDVFITTLSSVVSESYNIIRQVANNFQGNLNIHVYDTRELNVCEAVLALEAEKMMSQGHKMPAIAKRLDELRLSHKMLYPIEDLSYLIKNKKLSPTAGFFANLFNVKPVLQITNEGAIVPFKKIRKFDKAIDMVIDNFAEYIKRPNTFAYVLSTGRPEMDQYFVDLVQQRTQIQHLPIVPTSAISLANHGPTGVGLCAFIGKTPSVAKKLLNIE